MLNKFKGKTTAPTLSAKHKLSENLLKLAKDQSLYESVQNQMVDSYLQMRPKSFAENYFPYFQVSKLTKVIGHPVSFFLSFPLMFTLFWVNVFGMGSQTVPEIVTAIYNGESTTALPFILVLSIVTAILGLFEYFQHIALATAYKMYYQTRNIQILLIGIGFAFSVVSFVLSCYGALDIAKSVTTKSPELVQIESEIQDALELRKKHADRGNKTIELRDAEVEYLRGQKAKILEENQKGTNRNSNIILFVSIANELCIHFATFFIFFYMQRSSKEFTFINDLFKGHDYFGLNFLSISSGDFTNSNPEKKNIPQAAKATNNATAKAAILIDSKITAAEEQKGTKKPVHTDYASNVDPEKLIDFSRLEWYKRAYQKKVQTAKRDDSLRRRTECLNYILFKLSNFENEKVEGKIYFDLSDAPKYAKSSTVN